LVGVYVLLVLVLVREIWVRKVLVWEVLVLLVLVLVREIWVQKVLVWEVLVGEILKTKSK